MTSLTFIPPEHHLMKKIWLEASPRCHRCLIVLLAVHHRLEFRFGVADHVVHQVAVVDT